MVRNCELANRSTIRVLQCERHILICANGDLPTPGFDVRIEQSPLRIFPPQFNIEQCPRIGNFAQVLTPYNICRSFPLADRVPEISVHHAEGTDTITIEPCKGDLAHYEDSCRHHDDHDGFQVTGRSVNLSFDEAFADAIAQLPPSPHTDGVTRVKVAEIGGLFGGFAGFHELFVKIDADIDGIG